VSTTEYTLSPDRITLFYNDIAYLPGYIPHTIHRLSTGSTTLASGDPPSASRGLGEHPKTVTRGRRREIVGLKHNQPDIGSPEKGWLLVRRQVRHRPRVHQVREGRQRSPLSVVAARGSS